MQPPFKNDRSKNKNGFFSTFHEGHEKYNSRVHKYYNTMIIVLIAVAYK